MLSGLFEHLALFHNVVSNMYQHLVRLCTIVLFLRLLPRDGFVYYYEVLDDCNSSGANIYHLLVVL